MFKKLVLVVFIVIISSISFADTCPSATQIIAPDSAFGYYKASFENYNWTSQYPRPFYKNEKLVNIGAYGH